MKKSLHIALSAYFGAAVPAESWLGQQPRLTIKDATTNHYVNGEEKAIEQEFDGYHGYLYSYEMRLNRAANISIRVDRADMHVLYLMESNSAIKLMDRLHDEICVVAPQRARYFYLPDGDYVLQVPEGEIQLFGFYFDGRIFREGNDRPFGFIAELIQAYRHRAQIAYSSIDFRIGPLTCAQIDRLCAQLTAGDLDNEPYILYELTQLIKLSKEKVYDEYERTSDPELLIQRCRQLLATYIAREGNETQIKAIAIRLHVRPEYLSRLHQKYYHQKISDYRSSLLLERIKILLAQPFTLLDISLQCRFQGPSELSRFFKKHSGMTPTQFRFFLTNNN